MFQHNNKFILIITLFSYLHNLKWERERGYMLIAPWFNGQDDKTPEWRENRILSERLTPSQKKKKLNNKIILKKPSKYNNKKEKVTVSLLDLHVFTNKIFYLIKIVETQFPPIFPHSPRNPGFSFPLFFLSSL